MGSLSVIAIVLRFPRLYCLICCVLGLSLASHSTLGATHRALIIGIAQYPESSGWQALSSDIDIEHISFALMERGFLQDDIYVLADAEATRIGIISALERLTASAEYGDVIYIHYSGHGQQVLDQDMDEMDGLDEAIVPINSPMHYKPGYNEGENLVRDDELRYLLTALRKKLGSEGQLILVMDSCHSGTATRGMGRARGTDVIMAPADFEKSSQLSEGRFDLSATTDPSLSPLLALYASSARELNYETTDDQHRSVGSLSYALSKVMLQADGSVNFDEVYRRVRLRMMAHSPRQTPQYEGLGESLWMKQKGAMTTSSVGKRYSVTAWFSPSQIQADVGTMHEVYQGASISLHEQMSGRILTKGRIESTGLTQSRIVLDDPLSMDLAETYVTISSSAFPPISVTAENLLDLGSRWHYIWDELLDQDLMTEQTSTPDLLFVDTDDGQLGILSQAGHELYRTPWNDHARDRIWAFITTYAQGKFLKSLDHSRVDLRMDLSLLPIDCESLSDVGHDEMGAYAQIRVGSCARIKVINTGREGAYFSVLDIQTDNSTQVIVPSTQLGYTAEEYHLEPGAEYISDFYVRVGLPAGQESFKVIVSPVPLDLSSILSSRGTASRDAYRTTFEHLLAHTYTYMHETKAPPSNVSSVVGIYTYSFIIAE